MGHGRARGIGKLVNRRDLNRNMKRAGCAASIGRRVDLGRGKDGRCCCARLGWRECTDKNGKKIFVMRSKC